MSAPLRGICPPEPGPRMGATYRERSATAQTANEATRPRPSPRPHVVLDLAADPSVMTPEQRLAAFGQLLARALYRRIDRREQSPHLNRPEQKRNKTRS